MKRALFLSLYLSVFSFLLAAQPWSQRMVEAHGIRNFYSNTSLKDSLPNSGWDYVAGLVANSVLKAWEAYPEKTDYYRNVKAFADKFASNVGANLGASNIDDLAAGKMYFALYRKAVADGNATEAAKYKNAVTVIRNKLKYTHSRIAAPLPGAGGFWHKASYPNQMWLDGLYMGPAVYAQWQAEFGATDSAATNAACWSDIALQFKTLNTYTYDSVKQLNYHGWAAAPSDANAFWANQSAPNLGCSKEFWGRSMGWMFAALVDVMEGMPKDHPDYVELLKICRQVASGLKRWQDANSGVWYQLLQYDGTKIPDPNGDPVTGYNKGTQANYLESSCSGMFTYAYLKAIRLGFIDGDTYLPVARKAYQGMLKTFITETAGKLNIIQSCASAGLGPSNNKTRSGTVNYYLCGSDVKLAQNEGKAIGPFIMASLEYEKYQEDSAKATPVSYPGSGCCDRVCRLTLPADGIYLFRISASDTLPVCVKSTCKAGENLIRYRSRSNSDQALCEVFTSTGKLLFRKEIGSNVL